MDCVRNITSDLVYVGASDRRSPLFEAAHPIPRGVSYNNYLLLDEKTVLMDTADRSVADRFFENVLCALAGRGLDYIVVADVYQARYDVVEGVFTVVVQNQAVAFRRHDTFYCLWLQYVIACWHNRRKYIALLSNDNISISIFLKNDYKMTIFVCISGA